MSGAIRTLSDLTVGVRTTHRAHVDAAAVSAYAALVGDHNPIHGDESYSQGTRFGAPVAHGLLVASYVQTALTKLVAPGGVSVHYTVKLSAPVHVGAWVLALATCIEIDPARGRATFSYTVATESDRTESDRVGAPVAVSGEATIAFPREKEAS